MPRPLEVTCPGEVACLLEVPRPIEVPRPLELPLLLSSDALQLLPIVYRNFIQHGQYYNDKVPLPSKASCLFLCEEL